MRYDGVINEILYYGEKSEDGRWVIPIAVDWDFTITKCSSWADGTMEINYEAFDVMKEFTEKYNVGWILDTMRPDEIIDEPLRILEENKVKMYGIRRNPQQRGDEPKVFAVFHIDDRNVGTPVKMLEGCERPHVDWAKIREIMTPILEEFSVKLNSNKHE